MCMQQNTHRLTGLDLDLPIGYKFAPKDTELVMDYLLAKNLGKPQPAGFVNEVPDAREIYCPPSHHHLNVHGVLGVNGQKALYFFFTMSFLGSMIQVIHAGKGCWKTMADDELICDPEGKPCAFKSRLAYFDDRCERTCWLMDVYRLADKFVEDNGIKGNEYLLARMRYTSDEREENDER